MHQILQGLRDAYLQKCVRSHRQHEVMAIEQKAAEIKRGSCHAD